MADNKRTSWISIVVVIIIAAGIYYVPKLPAFSKYKQYYAYYRSVNGLQPSSPVMIKGVRVGKIKSIDITGPEVKVSLLVTKDIEVPQDTKALLTSGGLLSDMSIVLEPGTSKVLLSDNSKIISALDTSVMPVSVRVTPYLEGAKYILKTADSTLLSFGGLGTTGAFTALVRPFLSAERSLEKYRGISASLNKKMDGVASSISSMNKSTAELANDSKEWKTTINNASAKSRKLLNDSLQKTVHQLASIGGSIGKVTRTASSGDNAVGKLVNDKTAYVHTTSAIDTLNQSLTELHSSPPGFRIFGKNKKKK